MFRPALVRLIITALVATTALAACSTLDGFQRQVIFRPSKEAGRTPAEFNATFEDVWLTVGRQPEKLHAWWIPAKDGNPAAPAALYLHGAGFGISANLPRIMKLHDEGFAVLAIDYRGFGKSAGSLPSEETAYEDADAAWAELTRRAPQARRYIYGHSLGGAIAIHLAATPAALGAAGLVVESSFTSVREMQQYTAYKWIPLGMVQTQFFDSLAKAPKLCMPTLVMHGSNDYRIPVDVARKLYAAAPEPKRWLLVDGARHIDIPTRYTAQWRAALNDFKALAAKPGVHCAKT
ncbi:MAG: alpha/beta fold hydrolase [Burkholderiales bacterium]|nr:alpha/beta fold hydrolase [Burkholderiales bacterium]